MLVKNHARINGSGRSCLCPCIPRWRNSDRQVAYEAKTSSFLIDSISPLFSLRLIFKERVPRNLITRTGATVSRSKKSARSLQHFSATPNYYIIRFTRLPRPQGAHSPRRSIHRHGRSRSMILRINEETVSLWSDGIFSSSRRWADTGLGIRRRRQRGWS